ncbi:MAG: sigma-70 family RNA polymerase sigma factor [Planctomycetota bacterium]
MTAPPERRPHPDASLLRRASEGDPRAARELEERLLCVTRFLAALNRRLGAPLGREELEDLGQDVLALVWRKRASYRGDCALSTWIHGFCSFELRNALRRKRRARPSASDDVLDELALPPPPPSGSAYAALHRALETLDAEVAAVLRWKHFGGLTFDRIAEVTGLSKSQAKRRYYAGLEQLRRRVEPQHGETTHG